MQLSHIIRRILPFGILLAGASSRAQVTFTLPGNPATVNISNAEYFFDTDPGPGNANALSLVTGNPVTISNASIPITGLTNGVHQFFVRTRDANGRWSLTNDQVLFIVSPVTIPGNPALGNVVKAEYFFDTDPGPGSGISIPITAGTNTTVSNYAINISALASGVHRLYLRTADANGHWSLTNETNLAVISSGPTIPANPVPGNITLLEYFFDTDPGYGNGTAVAITATTNLVNYTFPIDVSSLAQGNHNLFIRVFDGWSQTSVMPLSVGAPLPITLLSFTASLQPGNTVLLSWATTNETDNRYFAVQRSSDGNTFDSIGAVPGAGTTDIEQHYSYTDSTPSPKVDYYRLRQVDIDGHATYSPIVSVNLQSSLAFNVMPNPAHDLLTVNMGTALKDKGIFRIVDMEGRIVLAVSATTDNIQQLNISGLTPGAYILQYLTGSNGNSVRFVKF